MDAGSPINRYQFFATIREGVLEWTLELETEGPQRHSLRIRDGEEVPILLDIFRRDSTVYFDAASGTIRTGLNKVGPETKTSLL